MMPFGTSDFGHMLSVGAIHFEDGSALAERVGQGEVGGRTALADSAWRQLQLPVYRKTLVNAGDSAWRRLQLPVESLGQCQVGHLSISINGRTLASVSYTVIYVVLKTGSWAGPGNKAFLRMEPT